MSREFELREQLKSQSLGDVNPSAFRFVGSTVFPDRAAKFDLNDFVEVINAYRATHLPTFGHIIPSSSEITDVVLTDNDTQVTLIDLTGSDNINTVVEVFSIAATLPGDYELGTAYLVIELGGKQVSLYDIANIDAISARTAGILYGAGISYNDRPISPRSIFVSGGEKLVLVAKNKPNTDFDIQVLTRKRSQ